MGQRSSKCRNLITEVRNFTSQLTRKLRQKYKRKVDHLITKYKVDRQEIVQGVPKLVLHFLFAHFSGSEASRNKILGTKRELVASSFEKCTRS